MSPETGRGKATKRPRGADGRRGAGHTKKPTVAVVGAGRLGTALALALEAAGYEVTALVARRRASALRSSRLLRSPPPALGADALARLPASDLLVIATPDDLIAQVAARLAAALPEEFARHRRRAPPVALHASGALASDALSPLRARGFATGSLHPLVSVADPSANAPALRGAYYCVEGEARATSAARRAVRALGGRAFTVAARDKALYHAAAAVASGHSVALFDLACELLARCGLPPARARRVLLPLARTTLANLSAARANAGALTGPLARADLSTVRKHLDALAATGDADALAVYTLLGRRALSLAAALGDREREAARALLANAPAGRARARKK